MGGSRRGNGKEIRIEKVKEGEGERDRERKGKEKINTKMELGERSRKRFHWFIESTTRSESQN